MSPSEQKINEVGRARTGKRKPDLERRKLPFWRLQAP